MTLDKVTTASIKFQERRIQMCVQYCNTETDELQQCFEYNKNYAGVRTCWSDWLWLDKAQSNYIVCAVADHSKKEEVRSIRRACDERSTGEKELKPIQENKSA